MIKCPHCGELMTEAWVMKNLPEDIVMSEGARLMSLRNPRKITPERARKAAQAKWLKHKQWKESQKGIPSDQHKTYREWRASQTGDKHPRK
jgi:hypothetical protein